LQVFGAFPATALTNQTSKEYRGSTDIARSLTNTASTHTILAEVNMPPSTIETQDALRRAQESLPWVLQMKHTDGSWKTVGKTLPGRMAAMEYLNKTKEKEKDDGWRVLPKNEADKYIEGLRQGLALGRMEKPTKRRRPTLALPENL
jgi:hypothetical protein